MAIIVWKDYGTEPQQGLTSVAFPLALPQYPSQRQIKLIMHDEVGVARSPYTGQAQVQKYDYEGWILQITLPPMKRNLARTWCAWEAALQGRYGYFLCGDQSMRAPQGAGTGTPLVDGGSQTGRTLATKGWDADTLILRSGDYIQLGSGATTRLHMNLCDVTSDGSGGATLNLWPKLRESPADDAVITVNDCVGTFRLISNDRQIDIDRVTYGITFTAEEKL